MRSRRYALFLAVGYAALAALYIVVSSRIAADMAGSVEELKRIETLKGVLFVTVTALAVFFGAWAMMSRLERADDQIRRRDAAILMNDRRMFAGLLAATTAHDANNVLMGVIADLQSLRGALGDEPKVARVSAAMEKLVGLNRRLLDVVRQGRGGDPTDVHLMTEIKAAIESVRAHLQARGCEVNLTGDEGITLRSHPLLLHQITTNLVVNAAEAMLALGRVDVTVTRSGPDAVIEVNDSGPGVPEERRAGLFDALQTTKPGGSGLGLFSVKACATALGGTAEVTSSSLGGACFRVRIPLSGPGRNGNTAPAPAPRAAPAVGV